MKTTINLMINCNVSGTANDCHSIDQNVDESVANTVANTIDAIDIDRWRHRLI